MLCLKEKLYPRTVLAISQNTEFQKDYSKWQTSVGINTSVKNNTTTGVDIYTETSVEIYTHKRKKEKKDTPNSNEIRTNAQKKRDTGKMFRRRMFCRRNVIPCLQCFTH